MRVLRTVALLCAALGLAGSVATLSGCCDCPTFRAAIAKVRLLNASEVGPDLKIVFFYFYRHGEDFVPADALASGTFLAQDETPEEYAMRDGEIYFFGGGDYDLHVFVDMDNTMTLTPGDMEKVELNVYLFEHQIVEVDYTTFEIVEAVIGG